MDINDNNDRLSGDSNLNSQITNIEQQNIIINGYSKNAKRCSLEEIKINESVSNNTVS